MTIETPSPLRKGERTRVRILRNAARLFADNGYAGLSMDRLAGSVKLTKAALYVHFKSKQDIYTESIIWYIDHCTRDMPSVKNAEQNNARPLIEYLSWFITLVENDRIFRMILIRLFTEEDHGTLDRISRAVFIRPFQVLTESLARARPELNADEYAYSLVAIALLSPDMKKVMIELSDPDKVDLSTTELLEHLLEILGVRH